MLNHLCVLQAFAKTKKPKRESKTFSVNFLLNKKLNKEMKCCSVTSKGEKKVYKRISKLSSSLFTQKE